MGLLAAAYFSLLSFVFVRRVLHEHIQRLSKVVTANHKALQIPEVTTSPSRLCLCSGWGEGRCFTRRSIAFLSVTADTLQQEHPVPVLWYLPLIIPNVFFSEFDTSVWIVRFKN